MSMQKTKNAVVVTGKYTNNAGEEKNSYMTIGSLFEREDGSLVMKLDAVPVGSEFSGWVNFYDPKPRDGQAKQEPKQEQRLADDPDDEIPFD